MNEPLPNLFDTAIYERIYHDALTLIHHADLGSRNAYKIVQCLKPIIDYKLEQWAREARTGKGPARA